MDLEQESTIAVDEGDTKTITEACNKLIRTQKQIETLEEQLKKTKETERNLSEEKIPSLMHKAGVSMLKLADGTSVEINKKYYARIPVSKMEEAHNWLRSNGHEDIIKNDINMSFAMKQDNEARSLAEDLKQKGYNVKQKTHVHHGTLSGFVKEQISSGNNVPHDLFGIYVADKTKIITKE